MLQATGSHAWAVSGGWVQAARDLGVLGATLAPRAEWGATRLDDDGGLAAWLAGAGPEATALLLGFDWHSQALHRSAGWRRRWKRARARKLLYVQESIGSARRLTGSDEMERTFRSAAELCDGIVFTDLADRALVERAGKPCLWQPFGVDTHLFHANTPLEARTPRAFFRGKVDAFLHDGEYADRRRLLEALRARDLVDVIPYAHGPVAPDRLVEDFNRYRIAVNLPSVFASHPTRVPEAMACGCCLVTNRTGSPELDALLQDGVEVLYYSNEVELVAAVERAREDVELARAVAEGGMRAASGRFSLTHLLSQALAWWAGAATPLRGRTSR